jgi:mannose-6-phosphate isomerase-like protein (cupin superfamily)
MIHFRSGETPPDWCELRGFALVSPMGGPVTQLREARRERLLVTRGRCNIAVDSCSMVLRAGQFIDVPDDAPQWEITATTDDAECLRLSGLWGEQIAGCGLWTMVNEPGATNGGDPVSYPKQTRMDSHYHDYDEYWFILEGAATVVVSGEALEVRAGDCVATGAGHHHDMPLVHAPVRGAFFETSLIGRKRLGHLWVHTHGPASPLAGRL